MVRRVVLRVLIVLLFLLSAGSTVSPAAAALGDDGAEPVVGAGTTTIAAASGPIIIDHTCTDLSQIPDYWIEQAKQLTFHIAHTSHGSQILSGIQKLEQIDATYNAAVRVSDVVALPTEAGALLIYDGNNLGGGDTYITPEEYWDSAYGISRTQSVADTGWFDISTWTWCGQQSSNAETTVQRYMDTVAALENLYPAMRFVLMTGHTDGGSTTLDRNNDMVRQYAQDHAMVLFDFADIETYDPLGGGPYDNNSEGTCLWCEPFCDAHPEYCDDLPSSCAHSDAPPDAELFCKLKGNAFWWMMARLAGWEGPAAGDDPDFTPSEKTVAPAYVTVGERVTYTIVIRDANAAQAQNVTLRDVLPSGLSYAAGTLAATAGTVDDAGAPMLTWHQALMDTPVVTVTYAATIDEMVGNPQTFTNTAVISAATASPISRTAVVWQDPVVGDDPDFTPSEKTVTPEHVTIGERVIYTVVIRDANDAQIEDVTLLDELPSGLSYASGTLTATAGTVDDTGAPALIWYQALMDTPVVTVTYAATIDEMAVTPQTFTNTAVISAANVSPISRTAVVRVNWVTLYLPVVLR